ncbi:MAG: hypothetical protein K0V04_20495 [Deltaproteobacteria bacterium]|nr:hypothetical protein [Deltaproteobacteria bacterium]
MSKLAELIGQAGSPISRAPKRLREPPVTLERELRLELEALLHLRDGFTTADGAVVVRPSVTVAAVHGVDDWNQLTLWRTPYSRASEVLFFAEDRFGQQFGMYRDEVVAFDAISGSWTHVAFGLERWAEHVLQPDAVGRAKVVAWQAEHEPLSITQRLQPRVPPDFVEAVDTEPEYRILDATELMRRLARLHRETREHPGILPEGFSEWWWDEG